MLKILRKEIIKMADILLQKPVAGQNIELSPQAEDRLVLQFDSSSTTLTRNDDALVMTFTDGASISLTDFYVSYHSENMPVFIIEGAEVDGEEFFNAFGEELMPAAGAAASPQGGGSTVDTILGNLHAGIDSLGRLDQGFEGNNSQASPLSGQGLAALDGLGDEDDNAGPVEDEETLEVIVTDKVLEVTESGHNNSGVLHDSIDFEIIDPNAGTPTVSFENTNGVDLSLYGTLSYSNGVISFELNDEFANSLKEDDVLTGIYKVTVSDGNGGLVEEEITITVNGSNDAPTVDVTYEDNDNSVTEDASDSIVNGNIIFDDVDSDGSTLYVNDVAITETQVFDGIYGRLTVNTDGSFTYEKGATAEQKANVEALGDEKQIESFNVVNKDPHNLEDSTTITINIDGENDIVSIDDSKSTSHITTDDTGLTSASGTIVFTSAESMVGGKITIGNQEYTISSGANGSFVLTGSTVDSVKGYGSITLDSLVYNEDTGEYTLKYTFDQTNPYLGHDNNAQGNELATNVDSFTITIEDAKEVANGGDNADSITINVSIHDDGISLESLIDKNDAYADPTAVDQNITREIRMGYINAEGEFVDLGSKTLKYENVDTFEANTPITNDDGLLVSTTQGAFATSAYDGIASIEMSISPDIHGTTKFLQIEGELVVLSDLFTTETGEQYYLIGHISDNNNDGVDDAIFGDSPDQFLQENLYAKVIFDPKTNTWTVEQYKEYDDTIVLEFTATDGDGDKASHNVAISGTTETFGPNIIAAEPITVDEAGLTDDTNSETAKGSIELTSNDGLQEVKMGDEVLATWNDTTKSWEISTGASVIITSITGSADTGYSVQYEYTLPEAVHDDVKNAENSAKQDPAQAEHNTSFDLTFVDKNNESSDITIDVKVLNSSSKGSEPLSAVSTHSNDAATRVNEIDLDNDSLAANNIIFGGMGDDVIFANANDNILADSGNDIITLKDFSLDDVLAIDGGDGIDILLSGVNNLDVVKGMLQNDGSSLNNMEIIMLGDDIEKAQELQEELTSGKDLTEDFAWQEGNGHLIAGHEYIEYNKEQEGEMYTILMRTEFV